MSNLRANLIRLAHENPAIRKEILPLLENRSAAKKKGAPVIAKEALRICKEIRLLEDRIGAPLEINLPSEELVSKSPQKYIKNLEKAKELAEKVLEARLAYVKAEGSW